MRNEFKLDDKVEEYIKDASISITIQTACDENSASHGYYFTPLFTQLQTLTDKQIDALMDGFNNLSEKERKDLKEQSCIKQNPLFCSIHMNKNTSRKPKELKIDSKTLVYSLNGFRYFTHERFFQYFAEKFRYLIFPLDMYNDNIPVLPYRPVLKSSPYIMNRILKSSIPGMLLKISADDSKPLCIALINPGLTFAAVDDDGTHQNFDKEIRSLYHLHVHFDGSDPYPGIITHLKLLYAEKYCDEHRNEVSGEVENSEKLKTYASKIYQPDKAEKYIPEWKSQEQNLRDKLRQSAERWATTQKKDNAWNNKEAWNRSTRLGTVWIRNIKERSRSILTTALTATPDGFIQNVAEQAKKFKPSQKKQNGVFDQ